MKRWKISTEDGICKDSNGHSVSGKMGNNSVEGFNRTSYIAEDKAKWIGRKVNGIIQIEVWRGKSGTYRT